MGQKKIIYFGLSGSEGRMGQAVQKAAQAKNSGFVLKAVWPSRQSGQQSGRPSGKRPKLQPRRPPGQTAPHAQQINGVIDFSAPALFEQTLKWCVLNKTPFVSGTTGLTRRQKNQLKQAAKRIPVFYEENMSWGIWRIKHWLKAAVQSPANITLEDIHHKHKKDQPSGTALRLLSAFPLKSQKKIKVKSVRRGREFGTHRILFKTPEETLLIEHKALSRGLFAQGALKALRWLTEQKKGLYGLDNLYNP